MIIMVMAMEAYLFTLGIIFYLETNACVWLEVKLSKGKSFLTGSLYRNLAGKVEWVDRFENFMVLVLKERKEIILAGTLIKIYSILMSVETGQCLQNLSVSQFVTHPTRVTTDSSTLIDHIYNNNEDNFPRSLFC